MALRNHTREEVEAMRDKPEIDTPRVNAIVRPWGTHTPYIEMCDLARTLERELAEQRAIVIAAQNQGLKDGKALNAAYAEALAGALRIIKIMASLPKAQRNGVSANDLAAICEAALAKNPNEAPAMERGQQGSGLDPAKAGSIPAASAPIEAIPVGGAFGWKVVPIEPTHAQLYAAGVTPEPIIEAAPGEPEYVPVAKMIYRAMLAAAPGFPGHEGWTQQMVAFLHGHGAQHYEPVPGEGALALYRCTAKPCGIIFQAQRQRITETVCPECGCPGVLHEARVEGVALAADLNNDGNPKGVEWQAPTWLLRHGLTCEVCKQPVGPPTNRYVGPAMVMGDKAWHSHCFPPEGVQGSGGTADGGDHA